MASARVTAGAQLLVAGQSSPSCAEPSSGAASSTSSGSGAGGGASENPMAAEQPVCYEPSRFLYPRLATGLAVNGLYPSSYADQSGYVAALGTGSAAFYPSLVSGASCNAHCFQPRLALKLFAAFLYHSVNYKPGF